jgi:hypothetical protein
VQQLYKTKRKQAALLHWSLASNSIKERETVEKRQLQCGGVPLKLSLQAFLRLSFVWKWRSSWAKNLAHSKKSTFSKDPRAGTQTDRLDVLNTMASVVVARNAPVTSSAAAKDGALPQIVLNAAVAKLYRYALVRGHQRTKGDALTRQLKLKTTEMRKSRWSRGVLQLRLVLENFSCSRESTFSKHHNSGSQTDGLDALNTMVPLTLLVDAAVKSYAA